jgi:hypothetical protein
MGNFNRFPMRLPLRNFSRGVAGLRECGFASMRPVASNPGWRIELAAGGES